MKKQTDKTQEQEQQDRLDAEAKLEEILQAAEQNAAQKATKNQSENNEPDYKQQYLRALADYQNLERRIEVTKKDTEKRTKTLIVMRFLGLLDMLEQAQKFTQEQGVIMIMKQIVTTMEDLGVKDLDVLNKEYDPYTAEALEVVEGEQDNMVTEVLRKGYALGEDVIRPAQVKVSKSKSMN